ncbi:MAG TPA: hypothetical protein VEV17_12310 [Bryobacteraceae bacterium]|nr:hypothetical protein [Bryobacteraceae bacterium]
MQAAIQTTTSVVRNWRICFIVASLVCAPALRAADPPGDLVRRVAARETETAQAQSNYMYRQSVELDELGARGGRSGQYREMRDIIFSPKQERTEQIVGQPVDGLVHLKLTEEDFRDIREIQPFLLTQDQMFLYETSYRGEEIVDGVDCFVLQARPKQILQGQRLFDGLFWVAETDYSIVRSEGQAVPQIVTTKNENLFPHFTTIRQKVDGGFWFPALTYADDTLPFRNGPQRIRLTIRYTDYRKFEADSKITFDRK